MVYEVLDIVLAGEYQDREEFQSMEGRGLALAKQRTGKQEPARTISVKSDSQCGQVRSLSALDQTPPQAWQNTRSPLSAMGHGCEELSVVGEDGELRDETKSASARNGHESWSYQRGATAHIGASLGSCEVNGKTKEARNLTCKEAERSKRRG